MKKYKLTITQFGENREFIISERELKILKRDMTDNYNGVIFKDINDMFFPMFKENIENISYEEMK